MDVVPGIVLVSGQQRQERTAIEVPRHFRAHEFQDRRQHVDVADQLVVGRTSVEKPWGSHDEGCPHSWIVQAALRPGHVQAVVGREDDQRFLL